MRVVHTHTSHVCMRVAAANTPEHCRHRWSNLKQQCGELITQPAAESPPACLPFSNRKGCGGAQVLCSRVLAMRQQTRGATRYTSHRYHSFSVPSAIMVVEICWSSSQLSQSEGRVTSRDKQPMALTHTHKVNLEFLIHFTSKVLEYGTEETMKTPSEATLTQTEHANFERKPCMYYKNQMPDFSSPPKASGGTAEKNKRKPSLSKGQKSGVKRFIPSVASPVCMCCFVPADSVWHIHWVSNFVEMSGLPSWTLGAKNETTLLL